MIGYHGSFGKLHHCQIPQMLIPCIMKISDSPFLRSEVVEQGAEAIIVQYVNA